MEGAFEEFVGSMFTLERWPWWSTIIVFTVVGQFTSTKLFTRDRAYREWDTWWKNGIWYWGRETLMLHPLAAGFVLGYLWQDPEGRGWPLVASMMYFATAGAVSMVAWAGLKGWLKKKGIDAKLPGESRTPPAPAPN